jgi:hypothetical protein
MIAIAGAGALELDRYSMPVSSRPGVVEGNVTRLGARGVGSAARAGKRGVKNCAANTIASSTRVIERARPVEFELITKPRDIYQWRCPKYN